MMTIRLITFEIRFTFQKNLSFKGYWISIRLQSLLGLFVSFLNKKIFLLVFIQSKILLYKQENVDVIELLTSYPLLKIARIQNLVLAVLSNLIQLKQEKYQKNIKKAAKKTKKTLAGIFVLTTITFESSTKKKTRTSK